MSIDTSATSATPTLSPAGSARPAQPMSASARGAGTAAAPVVADAVPGKPGHAGADPDSPRETASRAGAGRNDAASGTSSPPSPRAQARARPGRGLTASAPRSRGTRNVRSPRSEGGADGAPASFGTTLARTQADASDGQVPGSSRSARDGAAEHDGAARGADSRGAPPAALDAALALIAQQLAATRVAGASPPAAVRSQTAQGADISTAPGTASAAMACAAAPPSEANAFPGAVPQGAAEPPADAGAIADPAVPRSGSGAAPTRPPMAQDVAPRIPVAGASLAPDAPAPDAATNAATGAGADRPLLAFLTHAAAQAREGSATPATAPQDGARAAPDPSAGRDASLPVDGMGAASAAAAQLAPGAGAIATRVTHAPPATLQLSAPLGADGWAEELGGRISWAAHQGIGSASLRIAPEHLGPVDVKIQIHAGNASVWFGAAQPETRAALEQALPTLQAMFASSGLHLADAGVSREAPRGSPGLAPTPARSSDPIPQDEPSALGVARRPLGLVDTFV